MKTTSISAIFMMAILLWACRKKDIPDLPLPAASQTGQNTLGFLLNEKVWANFGRRCTIAGCSDNAVSALLYKQPNGDFTLEISAGYTVMTEKIDQSFYIYTTNIITAGTYLLDSSLNRRMAFNASRYNQTYREYRNIQSARCSLTITKFDTVNKIVAGNFSGIIYNPVNLTDSTKILDGRFDAYLVYRQ